MAWGIDDLRAAAREAEARHDWAAALRQWDDVAVRSGEPFWDPLFATRAAARAGLLGDALERHARLVVIPDGKWAHAIMGAEIEELRHDDAAAIPWWRRALETDHDLYWAKYGLARSLSRTGALPEARMLMTEALAHPLAEQGAARFGADLDLRTGQITEAHRTFAAFGISEHERDRTVLAMLPGMTSFAERWCLKEVAARSLTGAGTMVDLGAWLGSLSAAMAIGAAENPALVGRDVRIEAFDQFIWLSSYMDALWEANWSYARPADGESFLPAFRSFTAPWSDRIRVRAGDLENVRWGDEPIELASVDAMKSPTLARIVMREFYPALLPGAFLFHQDFCHSVTWWIHLQHFLLRDYLQPIDVLEGSAGVLFSVTQRLPLAGIERVIAADLSDAALAADAFAYSAELVAPSDRGVVALAQARCALKHGRTSEAEQVLDAWRDDPGVGRELRQFGL